MADRIQAIDVLRGVTVALMIVVNTSAVESTAFAPLLHADWNGLTLADLVFPTFLFVVGAAHSFVLDRYGRTEPSAVLRKIAIRTLLIFLCGYLLEWFPFFSVDSSGHLALVTIAHTRILGVLQRIALCYGCAALIVHAWRIRGAVVFGIGALLGYWWLLYMFGDYTATGNAILKVDRLVLGEEHMHHAAGVAFDQEGLLSTLPAIVNVLAGYLTGRFLVVRGTGPSTITRLVLAGALCALIALCWNTILPFNKNLWTSSYVLCATGIDLAVLAVLIHFVSVGTNRAWVRFLGVFGRNALFVYMFCEAGNSIMNVIQPQGANLFSAASSPGIGAWLASEPGSLFVSIICMLLCWCLTYAVDRSGLRIKI
ncbi:MAG TPA: heparan-alpha-glucosaminide N-acetyltransferase domain-containing protein [Steroidobacteraceae bacterium]